MNQELDVNDYMEIAPKNVTLVKKYAAETLFVGHTWGWDGINHRAVLAHNQSKPSFKNGGTPQRLSYI